MAKPNYSFEKRQRELAKKKKKEEKLKEKEARKTTGSNVVEEPAEPLQNTTAANDGAPADSKVGP
ncbi:hypothetical protein [Piscinibacter sp.]|uniref:hypothetical protein n=1 Tax=Piscinibacter sp. TaxID=1903157 RepID=UPI002CAC3CD2|nr:hypothetical protein [Albitalea sp.]HUG23341.1 hypothetical protein [Albitalea sp.]